MKRILIEIMYDGSAFNGWQVQNKQENSVTIQGVLQDVLSKFLNENIILYASGRTDAGVHARKQVAHFDTQSSFDFSRLPNAVNNHLPKSVVVLSAKEASASFHARFSAKQKTYKYVCYMSKTRLPLYENKALQVPEKLNFKEMKKAMRVLKGKHDFTSFCTKKNEAEKSVDFEKIKAQFSSEKDFLAMKEKLTSNIRIVTKFKVKKDKDLLVFKIQANGFLHNMVRIIIGTIIEVGKGSLTAKEVREILNAKDRTKAKKTLSGCGLYLWDVEY